MKESSEPFCSWTFSGFDKSLVLTVGNFEIELINKKNLFGSATSQKCS